MRYDLEYAPGFERRLERFLKFHPELKPQISKTLKLLAHDMNYPLLKTHKLHGKMKDNYACSINYYYRFVFELNNSVISLLSVGSHDDVY